MEGSGQSGVRAPRQQQRLILCTANNSASERGEAGVSQAWPAEKRICHVEGEARVEAVVGDERASCVMHRDR